MEGSDPEWDLGKMGETVWYDDAKDQAKFSETSSLKMEVCRANMGCVRPGSCYEAAGRVMLRIPGMTG